MFYVREGCCLTMLRVIMSVYTYVLRASIAHTYLDRRAGLRHRQAFNFSVRQATDVQDHLWRKRRAVRLRPLGPLRQRGRISARR